MSDARPAFLLRALDGGPTDLDAICANLRIEAPTALARATALWLWKREWERSHPQANRRGGDRKSLATQGRNQNDKLSFCFCAAQQLQADKRTVERDVKLADALGPAAIKLLWPTPVADNAVQLKRVAALGPHARARLFTVIRNRPQDTFDGWLRLAGLRAETESDEQKLRGFMATWASASAALRRDILDHIGVPAATAEALIQRWRKQHRPSTRKRQPAA